MFLTHAFFIETMCDLFISIFSGYPGLSLDIFRLSIGYLWVIYEIFSGYLWLSMVIFAFCKKMLSGYLRLSTVIFQICWTFTRLSKVIYSYLSNLLDFHQVI